MLLGTLLFPAIAFSSVLSLHVDTTLTHQALNDLDGEITASMEQSMKTLDKAMMLNGNQYSQALHGNMIQFKTHLMAAFEHDIEDTAQEMEDSTTATMDDFASRLDARWQLTTRKELQLWKTGSLGEWFKGAQGAWKGIEKQATNSLCHLGQLFHLNTCSNNEMKTDATQTDLSKRDTIDDVVLIFVTYAQIGVITVAGVVGFGIFKVIEAVVKALRKKLHPQSKSSIGMPGLDDVY